jgi:hypothetical protein
MSRATLDSLLADACPAELHGAHLQGPAVRVLARVAVLQGMPAPEARALHTRVAGLLARRVSGALAVAALLLVVVLAPRGSCSKESARAPVGDLPSSVDAACRGPWACVLVPALSGDTTARRRLRQMGAEGRDLLWSAAEAGQPEALRLLRGWGRLVDAGEVVRVRRLAASPATSPEALDLLVAQPNAAGAEPLAVLLVGEAALEVPVVDALRRLAARGEREEALRALLTGAAAGRAEAAAAAVDLGPASVVDRLLVVLPPAQFESRALAAALERARATVAARVLRRAEGGDEVALAWACAAGLEEAVPLLHTRAVDEDVAEGWHALDRLAQVGGTEAWLAVARSTESAAGSHALERLASLSGSTVEALVARAARSVRDRGAALWALACAREQGLTALETLGRRPALAPEVLAALERSPCEGAAERLRALGTSCDSALPAVQALGRRLLAGHRDAGAALVTLSHTGSRRAALQALAAAGDAGERFLAQAGAEPASARGSSPGAEGPTGPVPRPPSRAARVRTL